MGLFVGGLGVGAGENLTGVAVGGLAVGAGEDLTGIAAALGGVGAGGTIRGVALGGLGVGAPAVEGAMLAGVAAGGTEVQGVSIAPAYFGIFDDGHLRGVSVSAVNNISSGAQHGLTIGIVNIADRLNGVQLGLLNIARNNPRGLRVLPVANMHFE